MKIYDQTYDQEGQLGGGLTADEYELCYFVSQNISSQDLSNTKFIECTFRDCNLSNAILGGTAFQEVTFENCKMLGMNFTHASKFLLQITFTNCQLDFCDFTDLNLKGTDFGGSRLVEADFSGCNLSKAKLAACDLERTIFRRTQLAEADLREARNFDIDPENNQLKKANFSLDGLLGLLRKHGILVQ